MRTSIVVRAVGWAFVLTIAALSPSACSRNASASKEEHLKRGNDFVSQGKLNEAALEFEIALKIDPEYGDAQLAAGKAYHDLGDHPRATKAYARAADLMPDDIDVQLRAGSMRLLSRDYLDAKTIADRVIAKDPKNIVALVLRANALAGLDELDTAVKQIESAIEIDPSRAELYTNLGTVKVLAADLKEAEIAYKKAISIAPTDARPYAAIGNFYWQLNRIPEAEQAFLKATEINPDDLQINRILATFYLLSGRPQQAEKFLRAVASKATDLDSKLRLADFLMLYGKKEEGLAMLRELARRPDGFAPATTRVAGSLYADGKTAEAHKLVDEVVAKDRIWAPALLVQAHFALFEKKPEEAMTKVQAALKMDPRLEAGHYFIGQLYRNKGDLVSAAASFKSVLQLNPRAVSAQLDLAEVQAESGKIDAAVSLADAAVSSSRGALGVRLRLVRLLFQQGDLKRAEGELGLLRKEFTPNAPVLSALGGLAVLRRDAGAARGYFEQALKLDPNDLDAISGLVAVDLMSGQPDSARRRADAALAKSPKRLDIVLLSAKTYGASGDLPKAENMLHRAIDLDPANPEAYGMLGQLMYTQGRLEDGRKEFEKIASEQPKNVAALTMLAIIAGRQGNDAEAIRRYEQILAIDRDAVYAANNLAFLYVQQNKQLDRAIELATMAQKRLPDEPSVADTLGWAYVKKNVAVVGLRFLRSAVDRAPTNAGFRYHLGAAYAQLKDKPNALAELQKALQIDPKFDGADAARQLLDSLKKPT